MSNYTSPFATCIQDKFLSHFLRTFSQNVSTCVYEHICVGLYLLCIYLNIIYIDICILYTHVHVYMCVCLYPMSQTWRKKNNPTKVNVFERSVKVAWGTTLLQTFNRSEAPNTCWSSPAQYLTWLPYSLWSTDMV